MRWFLNLCAGLDRLGVQYHVNDYRGLKRRPGAWAYVIGKQHVVEKIPTGHPIVYGPGVAAHPYESDFWERADIQLVLVSCQWFKGMYDRDLPKSIPTAVWPAGIDTERWRPERWEPKVNEVENGKTIDFLVYDKVRWEHDRYDRELLLPIRHELKQRGLNFQEIQYGFYRDEDFRRLLLRSRAMIFLCEHETQGFAYQQALSANVPILAWDRGGDWQDPEFYPNRVKFGPVSSVPYWEDRCGKKFANFEEFGPALTEFVNNLKEGRFSPREYVTENLSLEKCAEAYVEICRSFRTGMFGNEFSG
jgi:glycosyltransferase involved in cell wall biosynthesis